jgi:hypothetical protein
MHKKVVFVKFARFESSCVCCFKVYTIYNNLDCPCGLERGRMNSQNESFVDLIEKFPEWSTQNVEENLAHSLSVLSISFKC